MVVMKSTEEYDMLQPVKVKPGVSILSRHQNVDKEQTVVRLCKWHWRKVITEGQIKFDLKNVHFIFQMSLKWIL